jgi:hypothetical protein
VNALRLSGVWQRQIKKTHCEESQVHAASRVCQSSHRPPGWASGRFLAPLIKLETIMGAKPLSRNK